jgi:ribosomal protein L12E/L44/L45/RPP1/RPP2
MEIKPPTKPGKNADEKALLAYHSELRRYHRLLEAEDARLQQQIRSLKIERLKEIMNVGGKSAPKQKALPGATLPGPECGCSIEAACDGCDCPECETWRKDYKVTDTMVEDWNIKDIIQHAKTVFAQAKAASAPAPTTDEATKFFAQYEEQMAHPERDDEQRTHN